MSASRFEGAVRRGMELTRKSTKLPSVSFYQTAGRVGPLMRHATKNKGRRNWEVPSNLHIRPILKGTPTLPNSAKHARHWPARHRHSLYLAYPNGLVPCRLQPAVAINAVAVMGFYCEVQMVCGERNRTFSKADAASGACKSKDSSGPAPLRNPTSLHRPTASLIIFRTIADWHAFGSYREGSYLLLRCLGSRSPFHRGFLGGHRCAQVEVSRAQQKRGPA